MRRLSTTAKICRHLGASITHPVGMSDLHALTRFNEGGLILASNAAAAGEDPRALRRAVATGELIRVIRGVYAETPRWQLLDSAERFRLFVSAMSATMNPGAVFSHHAAAALLGIPMLGRWPRYVEVTVPATSGGRSNGSVRRYGSNLHDDDIVEVDGLLCTNPARTVADLARTLPFMNAVASADAALHRKRRPTLLTLDQLQAQSACMHGSRGFRRIERVVSFSTPLSDSVHESSSRVCIYVLGFPAPVLQQRFSDSDGLIGETDFWWPKYNLIGEFDGLSKYLDRELRRGRTAAQVVVDEKLREDRLRRCGPNVARWIVADLEDPQRLYRKLVGAGLPAVRR